MLGRWPESSVIQTNVKERNVVLLAVIAPLGNPVSPSRLHTLILGGRARETGEKRERLGREDGQQTGEWDHYMGDGGKKEG